MPKAIRLSVSVSSPGASSQMPSPKPSLIRPPRSVAENSMTSSSEASVYCRRKTIGQSMSRFTSSTAARRSSAMAWQLSVERTSTAVGSSISTSTVGVNSWSSRAETKLIRSERRAEPYFSRLWSGQVFPKSDPRARDTGPVCKQLGLIRGEQFGQ